MRRKVGEYDHLNNPDDLYGGIVHRISLDELAKSILDTNYGLNRFLSALNRAVHDPTNTRSQFHYDEVETLIKAFENLH